MRPSLPSWVLGVTALALALAACTPADKGATDTGTTSPSPTDDADGDGFAPPEDCDDTDADVNPAAEDVPYDGVDSDCGGGSDNDADGDGYDWDGTEFGVDCDDGDDQVHPGALETCDGLDNDCDGATDPPGTLGEVTVYTDIDQDGFGDDTTAVTSCTPPTGAVEIGGDCDDLDYLTYPGAPAVQCDGLDNDCDPATFEAGLVTLDGVPKADLTAALDDAFDGATIDLCEGRYTVDAPVIAGSLAIVGVGSQVTVIDAQQTGPVFEIASLDPVSLTDLMLTGGLGLDEDGEKRGGGLYLHPGTRVDAYDVVVTGNVAGAGGGAWLSDGATFTMSGGAVTANHADSAYAIVSSGGGIQAGADARITLASGASIDHNDADMCGGASVGAGALVDGTGTGTIAANATLGLQGGGICVDGSTLRALDISGNHSQNRGGGVDGYDVVLQDCTVTGNTSDLSGAGGALFGVNSIVGTTLSGNVSGIDGGALTVELGTTTLTSSVVSDNHATFFASYGGGVSMFQSTLVSVATDWADGVALPDNAPFDIGLIGLDQGFSFLGVADFTCVDDGAAGGCN